MDQALALIAHIHHHHHGGAVGGGDAAAGLAILLLLGFLAYRLLTFKKQG